MFKNSKAFSGFSVDDLQKAKEFYGKTLGINVKEEGNMGLTLNLAGRTKIFIYPKENHVPATYTILNFLDWMILNLSDDIKKYISDLTNSVDTILLGRKMTHGFFSYWTDYVKNKPDSEEYPFAKQMVDYPKVVFTKTLDKSS